MKFTVKSAGQYSNVLSDMITNFSFRGYDKTADGLVQVTEISQKSKIVTGKPELTFEDEEKEIKPTNKIAQVNPMTRIQILKDLVEEKNKIDYEINKAKQEGRRVIAVGTTSCRVLESIANEKTGMVKQIEDDTEIFIYPGYKFKCIDGLITNFHLPQSTLLMLVSALAGKEYIMKAYKEAVKEKYRFFSFGDAMFIY